MKNENYRHESIECCSFTKKKGRKHWKRIRKFSLIVLLIITGGSAFNADTHVTVNAIKLHRSQYVEQFSIIGPVGVCLYSFIESIKFIEIPIILFTELKSWSKGRKCQWKMQAHRHRRGQKKWQHHRNQLTVLRSMFSLVTPIFHEFHLPRTTSI